MITGPVNPNSIDMPLIQTGCLKSEFNSTYPVHLNGIIRPDEFQQSIENINRIISSRKSRIIVGLIAILSLSSGMVLFILGGVTRIESHLAGFPILVGIGLGIFGFGMLVLSIGCCVVQLQTTTRLQQAVANESMKYSTRSPPCSWRLHVYRTRGGGYRRRRNTRLIYRLVIEIGNPAVPGSGYATYQFNQVAPQSTSIFSEQNNMPPPYYHQSVAGFCSHCGIPRPNITAKFCSSCGHSFNVY
ncbi:unnamed protein product [Rotaria sordida]|uniref:Uncharacterized protein n=1 Tax=Rotaria sordida TaxID=392033 RepID=A0A819QCC7_9BILA|nr:unnamed protein product [Rotaria sordida]CAF4022737.1 unnamed protein product [Rotaria sordida]